MEKLTRPPRSAAPEQGRGPHGGLSGVIAGPGCT